MMHTLEDDEMKPRKREELRRDIQRCTRLLSITITIGSTTRDLLSVTLSLEMRRIGRPLHILRVTSVKRRLKVIPETASKSRKIRLSEAAGETALIAGLLGAGGESALIAGLLETVGELALVAGLLKSVREATLIQMLLIDAIL